MTFSLAVHAAWCFPGWPIQPASSDVARGPVSLEVDLWSIAQLPAPETPQPMGAPSPQDEAWLHERTTSPAKPAPSPALLEGHGAMTEATPQVIRNPPPAYPWMARIRGWEGTVVLEAHIEPNGRASQVRVATSSGHPVLDDVAYHAVSRWEFVPAKRGGRAVGSMVKVPVRFRLTEEDRNEP